MKTEQKNAYHITIDGKPYCQAEGERIFGEGYYYPTNCAHGSLEEAEEGAESCRKLLPHSDVRVIPGRCGDDPFWQTEEGRDIIESEDEWQQSQWE